MEDQDKINEDELENDDEVIDAEMEEVENDEDANVEDADADADQVVDPATEGDKVADEVVEDVVEALQAALEAAQLEAAQNHDAVLRAQAEFSNYKKRMERDQEAMRHDAVIRSVKRFLDVADDMDRALAARPAEGEGAEWAEGVELIYRKLMNSLEAEGVTPMDAEGQVFDPNKHEAIGQVDSDDHDSGHIVEVIQNGYQIGDRVVRPALVRIAS